MTKWMKPAMLAMGLVLVVEPLAMATAPQPTVAFLADGDRERGAKFTGELAVLNGQKLTVVRRGDAGETTGNFEANDKTKIVIESLDQYETYQAEGGPKQRSARLPGKLADLKIGQRIEVTEVDGVATEIFVPKPKGKRKPAGEAPREGVKDGERPKEGPRDGERPKNGGDRPKEGGKEGDRPREGGAPRKNGEG